MADYFLSCDWGTSSFRLKLISIPELQVVGEESSVQGISSVFNEWETKNDTDQVKRQSFYFAILAAHISALEKKMGVTLKDIPVVLSGMASSTIGIIDIPYTYVPFSTDGTDIKKHLIPATTDFQHDVFIISGARTDDDVMRGEETQLIGCIEDADFNLQDERLFIFPGTHSKHITVKSKQVVTFRTFMTGEFFALLCSQSILHTAVKKHGYKTALSDSFINGVESAAQGNLLHEAFMVRTNNLFKKLDKEENYDYLSGLLIGTELKYLLSINIGIYLCCNSNLAVFYSAAINALGLSSKVNIIPPEKVDESVIAGQYKFLKNK